MPGGMIAVGLVGSVVAIGTFGGAIRETFILQSLRDLYNSSLEEPAPEHLTMLVQTLGEDEDGDQSY